MPLHPESQPIEIAGKDLIGVGGLNIDPYSLTPKVGRVRHLYIRPFTKNWDLNKPKSIRQAIL
jgi:hypothetical protein